MLALLKILMFSLETVYSSLHGTDRGTFHQPDSWF